MKGTFSQKGRLYGPIMPSWILENRTLSLGAKVLYAQLANHAADGCNYCFPSQARLSTQMSASLRSIQNWLRELTRLGFIKVDSGKAGRVCRYYFLARPEAASASIHDAQGCANYAQGYANRAYRSKVIDKYNIPPLPPTPSKPVTAPPPHRDGGRGDSFSSALESCRSGFEQVWSLWPVKQAEQQAWTLWKQLWFNGKLPRLETLLAKVRELQSTDSRWKRGYAPLLANWLRGARWTDLPVRQEERESPANEQSPHPPADPEAKAKAEALFVAITERSRRENAAYLAGRQRKHEFQQVIAEARTAHLSQQKQGIVHAIE